MVVSLAVAALTRSHVIAIEWVDLMAEDNSCCSMMAVDESASGSVVRMHARVEGGGKIVGGGGYIVRDGHGVHHMGGVRVHLQLCV